MNFTDSVYKRLMNFPVGNEIEYHPAKGSKEKWDEFIVAVKRYINDHHIHPDHTIEIRDDYLGVRKVMTPIFPTKKITT